MSDLSLSANLHTVFALEVRHLVSIVQKKSVKQTSQDLLDLDKTFPVTQTLVCCVIQQVCFSGKHEREGRLLLNIYSIGKEEKPFSLSALSEKDQAKLQLLYSFLSLDTLAPGFASSIVDAFETLAPGSFLLSSLFPLSVLSMLMLDISYTLVCSFFLFVGVLSSLWQGIALLACSRSSFLSRTWRISVIF